MFVEPEPRSEAQTMKPDVTPRTAAHQERWRTVMYDAGTVDGDIEVLVQKLQQQHGYQRAEANAELLRRLSGAMG